MRVYREVGRQPLPTIELKAGERVIWDNRFVVKAEPNAPKALIAPISNYRDRSYYGNKGKVIPHSVWITMPSIVIDGEVVSSPFIDDHHDSWNFLFPRTSLCSDNKRNVIERVHF